MLDMKTPLLITTTSPQIKFILIFFLANFTLATLADDDSQFHFADVSCLDTGNYTAKSTYQNNLLDLLHNQTTASSFGHSFVGEGSDKVYTLYNCRGDLNSKQCQRCVKQAVNEILERCPFEKESIIWFEECMVRYANRTLLSLEEQEPNAWGYSDTISDEPTPHLIQSVSEYIDGSIKEAAYKKSSGGFATGQTEIGPHDHVYFLVQCTTDILGDPCEKCLRAAFKSMDEYGNLATSTPLMMFYPSCHIRYDRKSILLNGAKYSSSKRSSTILASAPSDYSLPSPPFIAGISNARILCFEKTVVGIWAIFAMLVLPSLFN